MKEIVLQGKDTFPALAVKGEDARIAKLMKKIRAEGGSYTIGVLGGSISEGAGAQNEALCYGNLVCQWWIRQFPNASFTFVNAGIGATNPEMGCYRFSRDFEPFNVDFAVLDYADNTYLDQKLDVTVPTLLYRMLSGGTAVMGVYFSRTEPKQYAQGIYAQDPNVPIPEKKLAAALEAYGIPTVDYHTYVWDRIGKGMISWPDIGSDNIHPNNAGHRIAAAMICAHLEEIAQNPDAFDGTVTPPATPKKDTYLQAYSIIKGDERVTLTGKMQEDTGNKPRQQGWNCTGEGSLTVMLPPERRHAKMLVVINGEGNVILSGAGKEKKLTKNNAASPTLIDFASTLGSTVTVTSKLTSGSMHIYYIGID